MKWSTSGWHMTETFKLIYGATKMRLGFLIAACTVAGVVMSPENTLSPLQLTVLGLAVLASSSAAGAFNQFYERDIDGIMTRTQSRAFVTGRLHADRGWLVGIVLTLLVALVAAALATNVTAMFYVFLGAFTYGVVYTMWLKRRTWLNIVIGGLAGSFAALAGSAAVDPQLPAAAWVFAAALFFWTPPHFWSLAFYNKRDYARAGVPMLPNFMADRPLAIVVLAHTVVLVALTLMPALLVTGWFYTLCAAIGGAYFIWTSAVFVHNPSRSNAMATFHGSLWQLGLLLLGAIASAVLSGHLAA